MRDFFKPWRRKAGVVTLVMACVFAAGWVRSTSGTDHIQFLKQTNPDVWFNAHHGRIGCVIAERKAKPPRDSSLSKLYSMRWFFTADDPGFDDDVNGPFTLVEWQYERMGFGFGTFNHGLTHADTWRVIAIPYWSIVIPLTLLSAWLLLRKPRSAAPKTTAPAPTTGT